jgi:hypothetical protein
MARMEERRRSPRRTVHGEIAVVVPTIANVQLLDVSLSGVLLLSDQSFEMGTEGGLSVNLDGSRFRADVHVQRVVAASPEVGYRLGARFVALSPDDRQLIERFMAQ